MTLLHTTKGHGAPQALRHTRTCQYVFGVVSTCRNVCPLVFGWDLTVRTTTAFLLGLWALVPGQWFTKTVSEVRYYHYAIVKTPIRLCRCLSFLIFNFWLRYKSAFCVIKYHLSWYVNNKTRIWKKSTIYYIITFVKKYTLTFWPTIFFSSECATTGFQVCLNCGTSPSCQSHFLSYPESIEANCAPVCANDDRCDGAQYANETCSLYECAQPTSMPLSNSVFYRRTCAVNCKYVTYDSCCMLLFCI